MTNPSFLEFFVLEAGDYVQQLDSLLLGASATGPDAESLQRVARALRGSATMAKLGAFAEVAGGLERVGRGLQDHTLAWQPGLGGALIAAVDDLKILLHNARTWSSADDDRAATRTAELNGYIPAAAPRANAAATGTAYFAAEASNIAAGLELLATRPDDRDTATQVLRRARALRGVAGITDLGDLAEVLDATDDVARHLEATSGTLATTNTAVLRAAIAALRLIAVELRDGRTAATQAPERISLARAIEEWSATELDQDRIVPIADLFFADDGPHIVAGAAQPPTSAAERFRLELVSRGEHLRGLVETARGRPDESPERMRRQLRTALTGLARAAASFGQAALAQAVESLGRQVQESATTDLGLITRVAVALANPGERGSRVLDVLSAPAAPPPVAARASVSAPVIPQRVVPTPTPRRQTPPMGAITPPADIFAALDAGIDAIERLESRPLAAPAVLPDLDVVSIDSLLYRGPTALARARALRDEIRSGGPNPAALDELFDLLDLATVE